MANPGTCPYCGGFNQPKRGQRHIDCELCGARLAVDSSGTLLPADANATPLDRELPASTSFIDEFNSPSDTVTENTLPCMTGTSFPPAPELADNFFILSKANRKIVSGEQTGQSGLSLLTSAASGCMLLFLIPFVIAGFMVVGLFIKEAVELHRLNTAGQIAEGFLVERWTDTDDDGTSYHVAYEYSVAGIPYSGRLSSKAAYDRYERGAPIRVRYWPGNPDPSDLPDYPPSISPVIFLAVFSLFWNGITWGIVYSTSRKALIEIRLHNASHIQFIPGEIVKSKGYTDSDDDYCLKVTYEFVSPQTGKSIRRKQQVIRNDLKEQGPPAIGTPMLVLYRSDRLYKPM